ncbi:MAG: hypothetical protein WCV86_04200 [Patescibacteria group bacterium]|jgi:hypothetical protein
MKKRQIFFLLPTLLLLVFVLFQHADLTSAQNPPFTTPTLPAPSGSTQPFIDTSDTAQTKEGSLILDGTGPVTLCLGGDPTNPAYPSDCPADSDVNVLQLNNEEIVQLGVPSDGIPLEVLSNTSPLYTGFARLRAQADQSYAMGLNGNGSGGGFPWVAALVAQAGPQNAASPSLQRYGIRAEARVNLDTAYAIYGTDIWFDPANVPSSAYAAKFDGQTGLKGDLMLGDDIYQKQLCLNGEDSGHCISAWDPEGSGFAFIELQATDVPSVPQTGSVSLRGNGQLHSAIIGPIGDIPFSFTCGDLACNGIEAATGPNQCSDCL